MIYNVHIFTSMHCILSADGTYIHVCCATLTFVKKSTSVSCSLISLTAQSVLSVQPSQLANGGDWAQGHKTKIIHHTTMFY